MLGWACKFHYQGAENIMNIQVTLNKKLAQGHSIAELRKQMRTGLIIMEYLNAELSLGETASLLGMDYNEGRDWLHSKGVPTLRQFQPELENIARNNRRNLENKLKPANIKF